jgi:hypothetical protein
MYAHSINGKDLFVFIIEILMNLFVCPKKVVLLIYEEIMLEIVCFQLSLIN